MQEKGFQVQNNQGEKKIKVVKPAFSEIDIKIILYQKFVEKMFQLDKRLFKHSSNYNVFK